MQEKARVCAQERGLDSILTALGSQWEWTRAVKSDLHFFKNTLEGLSLKLQYFGHLMQTADSLEKTLMLGKIEGKKRRGQQRMRWLDSITYSMDMTLSKHRNIVNRGAWRVTVHRAAKSWTQLSN